MLLLTLGCGGAATKAGPDLRQEAVSLNEAGYTYYRQSQLRLAQEKFQQALALNRLIDHRAGMAANLNNLGAIAQEQKHLDQALACYQEAVELQRELGSAAGLSESLNNLGTVYQAQGKWDQAREIYRQALHEAQAIPPGPLLTLSLTHLGDVARQQKDYHQALEFYHQALRWDDRKKDRLGRAVRWERLGRTFLGLAAYPRAAGYFQEALQEFRQLEATTGIIDSLDGLTMVALAQGDEAGARLYGERLLKIYQARGQTEEAKRLRARLEQK